MRVLLYLVLLLMLANCSQKVAQLPGKPVAIAQDVVFFVKNDEAVPDARITDITADKVVVTANVKGKTKIYPYARTKVLMAFTKAGNYLVMSELSADPVEAKRQLNEFLAAPLRTDGNDYLIRTDPPAVIPTRISLENSDVIAYATADNTAASVKKNALSAILYKDGRYLMLNPPGQAAPVLARLRQQLIEAGKPAPAPEPPAVEMKSAPIPEPEPEVVAPTRTYTPRRVAKPKTMAPPKKEIMVSMPPVKSGSTSKSMPKSAGSLPKKP